MNGSNVARYNKGQAADTTRGPSNILWSPHEAVLQDPRKAVHVYEDFTNIAKFTAGSEANWGNGLAAFGSTGGDIAVGDDPADTEGDGARGVRTLSSDGDDEGASFRMVSLPFQIKRDRGILIWEARIKTSTITDTKHGFFLGLIGSTTLTATVPITAAGALADINLCGLHRLEGDGDKLDTVYKADGVTAVTVEADAITLVADTWIKVAQKFDPKDFCLRTYYNGIETATEKLIPTALGTDFPNDVRLGFVMAVLNATGTAPGSTSIDWFRGGQLLM